MVIKKIRNVFSKSLRLPVRSMSGKTTINYFWLIQCIEDPVLQYLEELDPVFNYEILKNVLLQRFNANEPEFMLNYYQTVFHKRKFSENESLQAYAFDLIVLANKAYPNINLHNLENIIIYRLAKGLGISVWSEHVFYQSPLILTELFQHNLINVSYLTACYLYQVMMTLHILNDVANEAESTQK